MTLWNRHAVAGTDPEKADCSLLCPAYKLFPWVMAVLSSKEGTMTTGGGGWDGGTLGVCDRGVSVGRQSSTPASLTQVVTLL